MSAFLITQRGPEIGRRYDLTNAQFTIGRGQDNDLVLGDGLVSRYHAVIRQENEGIVIIDLGSTNPVLVNDVPLEAGVAHRLLHRDVLVVGSAVLSYQHQAGASQPPPPAAPAGEPRTVVGSGLGGSTKRPGMAESPTSVPRAGGLPPLPHDAPVQMPPPAAYEPSVPPPPPAYEPAIPPRPAAYEPAIPPPPPASEPMTPGAWTPGSPLPPAPPPLTPPDLPPLPMTPEEARTVVSRRPDVGPGPASPLQTPGRPPEPDDETPTVIRHRSSDT
jgi:predicted component of type VI protein secretion system